MTHYETDRRRSRAAKFPLICGAFTLCVCLFLTIFYLNARRSAKILLDGEYFFLAKSCEETTAAALVGQVYDSGGAGVLIEADGQVAVALACYFTRSDAENVSRSLRERGTETEIYRMTTPELTIFGADSEIAARVSANARTADTCARILYDTANGLERASTSQEEARAAVRGVSKVLRGLCAENGNELHARWNAELTALGREGEELADGLLFSKDVRCLQVRICYALARFDGYYG